MSLHRPPSNPESTPVASGERPGPRRPRSFPNPSSPQDLFPLPPRKNFLTPQTPIPSLSLPLPLTPSLPTPVLVATEETVDGTPVVVSQRDVGLQIVSGVLINGQREGVVGLSWNFRVFRGIRGDEGVFTRTPDWVPDLQ